MYMHNLFYYGICLDIYICVCFCYISVSHNPCLLLKLTSRILNFHYVYSYFPYLNSACYTEEMEEINIFLILDKLLEFITNSH